LLKCLRVVQSQTTTVSLDGLSEHDRELRDMQPDNPVRIVPLSRIDRYTTSALEATEERDIENRATFETLLL
jgi:hypothetical protein